MPRGAALLLLAPPMLVAMGAAPARAQTRELAPILALEWDAPPECPDAVHVKTRVEALVGRSRGDKTLAARGRIATSSSAPRYRLELVVAGEVPTAARSMAGADCARLAEAAAVILALDIDPEALSRAGVEPPERRDEVVRDAAVVRPPVPGPPAGPRRRGAEHERRPPIEIGLEARVVMDSGTLPKTTLGLGAVASIAHEALSLDVGATAYQRQFASGPRDGAGGAYVDLVTVSAEGCGRKTLASVGLAACLGGELGREGTRGVAIAQPGSSAALWGALSASLQARAWPSRTFSPTAGFTFGHPVSAPNVVIQGFGTLFEPPVFFVRAHLGLEVRFF